jgi:signal transduction histidine kinase
VRSLIADGGGTVELQTVLGSTLTAVQPIQDDSGDGAFIVAYLTGQERDEFGRTVRTYAVVSLIALLAVSLGAWWVAGRLLSPIRQLRGTAQEITDTDLSRRIPVEGDDDMSDLVRTVNAMLERLDRAFATQRTFLDDAGHELRTPVTVLRGHLELLDPYDSADVTATRQLLLDEIDRMSRMVDDLILLAKADRPDFAQPAAVDVGALTDRVLDKARATADRDWRLDERAEGTVWLDAQRVTQALLQLASNAVRHTGPGDLVAFGSRLDSRALRFWVRDGGPGVDEDVRETIFERFHQGDSATAAEGSGLGLSIVRAIAEAHGGTAHVESPPGQGATFILTLPGSTLPGTVPGRGGHE